MTDETKSEDTTPETEAPKGPEWQKREFEINRRMAEVCQLGIKATESQITVLKRKLTKLQYGS